MRYRLDDLGWHDFEKLIQSLLKADLGLAVESWGGHGDLGRDSYTRGPLSFPSKNHVSEGPFIFQVKFVQEANAAGAKSQPLVMKAIRKEINEIKKRKSNPQWEEPNHYILITNAPLTTTARGDLKSALAPELPNTEFHSLGGSDVSDLLDIHPELRKAFPEILSLRDLDVLLGEVVNKEILERSRAAIAESRDLVPVFVPTRAYHEAWEAIQEHSFVVLDGPPEMGKTAIARTIAISHLLSDWQVVECRNPNDFFSTFDTHSNQLFVADDAFGRTEFDPSLGRMWERDLPRVFRCIDSRHRLVWTTRKHILLRAISEMDLTDAASHFPAPAEVVVTAGDLSVEEKARMLYRHGRAASLDADCRRLVRSNAVPIVQDDHFTPERIRRFVQDVLPDIASQSDFERDSDEAIEEVILEAIRNPTERMRKSYRKLHDEHKWVLIAYLECNRYVELSELSQRLTTFLPKTSATMFEQTVDDLLGTFLKMTLTWPQRTEEHVDWIHPSYRDLVIEELSHQTDFREQFLKRMSGAGVSLALSTSGGSSGERSFPLLITAEDWQLLNDRCVELATGHDGPTATGLLRVLCDASSAGGNSTGKQREGNERIIKTLYQIAMGDWDDTSTVFDLADLRTLHMAIELCSADLPLPPIEATWESCCEDVQRAVDERDLPEPTLITEWDELADFIADRYPIFAESVEYQLVLAEIKASVISLAEEEAESEIVLEEPEYNDSIGRRLEELAEAIVSLRGEGSNEILVNNLYAVSETYKENGVVDVDEGSGVYSRGGKSQGSWSDSSIERLFEDF